MGTLLLLFLAFTASAVAQSGSLSYYTEFTNLTGWTDSSQANGSSSNYQITESQPGSVDGALQFSVDPYSLQRPKISYTASVLHTSGTHEWRAYVPLYNSSDVTSAGMFLYADVFYEVDFECGSGPKQERTQLGVDSSKALCVLTSQSTDGKSLSSSDYSWVSIDANMWHIFQIKLADDPYTVTWSIDGQVVKTSKQQWGPGNLPANGFAPYCSLEQLSFMGDYGKPINFPAAVNSRPPNQFWVDHYRFTASASALSPLHIAIITLASALTLHLWL